jgi:hypothetical protein
VPEFRTFTAELYRLANWLMQCGVKIVAMESPGLLVSAVRDPRVSMLHTDHCGTAVAALRTSVIAASCVVATVRVSLLPRHQCPRR